MIFTLAIGSASQALKDHTDYCKRQHEPHCGG